MRSMILRGCCRSERIELYRCPAMRRGASLTESCSAEISEAIFAQPSAEIASLWLADALCVGLPPTASSACMPHCGSHQNDGAVCAVKRFPAPAECFDDRRPMMLESRASAAPSPDQRLTNGGVECGTATVPSSLQEAAGLLAHLSTPARAHHRRTRSDPRAGTAFAAGSADRRHAHPRPDGIQAEDGLLRIGRRSPQPRCRSARRSGRLSAGASVLGSGAPQIRNTAPSPGTCDGQPRQRHHPTPLLGDACASCSPARRAASVH
jgi:hypothetical protein